MKRLALLLLAACDPGAPIGTDDLALRIAVGTEEVAFGDAFPLTVVRSWRNDLVPQDWGERALAPLRLRLVAAARRANATHVEDVRRYEAFAFGRDPLVVAVPAFRARGKDGREHSVPGPELRLRVRSSLAKEPGPVELPGDPLPLPRRPRWPLPVVALAGLSLLSWMLWRRLGRTERRKATATAPGAAPHQHALARLAALAGAGPLDAAATAVWFTELASAVRDYAGARFAVRSGEMTSEELLACSPLRALPDDVRRRAWRTLALCDLVKFARTLPATGERQDVLASAEQFVRATAAESPP